MATVSESASCIRPEGFDTTSWTMVLQAAKPGEQRSLQAFSRICQVSWYPIYAFIRRLGYAQADAEDLAQGFFEHHPVSDENLIRSQIPLVKGGDALVFQTVPCA